MAAFVSRYASAFLDVVTAAKLDTAAIDRQLSDFLATWDGSAELRTLFSNPAVPAAQKVAILDKLNARLGLQKELRNLLAVLINNDRIGQVQRSGRGLSRGVAGAAGDSPGGDCDGARAERRRAQRAGGRCRQTGRIED